MNLVIHTDGGARGNPGPAAVGVVIDEVMTSGDIPSESGQATTKTKRIAGFGKRIGETTNNVAEYTAVIEAFRYLLSLKENGASNHKLTVHFYLDSTLVVNQLNGLFKVKESRLRELLYAVRELEQELGGTVMYFVVRREFNRQADFFVNQALDGE